jgi:hypothetical protein
MNLLPRPRVLKRTAGYFFLPKRATLQLVSSSRELSSAVKRLQTGAKEIGVELILQVTTLDGVSTQSIVFKQISKNPSTRRIQQVTTKFAETVAAQTESYTLTINPTSISIEFGDVAGLRASIATLRQLFREYGRRLPCLKIRDWPDFPRRGVMLDISRGRVPKLKTLLTLVHHLADFKINEFQLYTEHTFAYRNYKSVWRSWGALTATEIKKLDARCRELGIELVPNQNSFGHLRYFLEHPRVKKLAEVSEPYDDASGEFVRYPSTLAPNHPKTVPFLRKLYDELLPSFSSESFNVGCDETWDLGRGQSKKLCDKVGKGRVYLNFLKKICREVSARDKRMMFWGDIILNHPELIKALPKNIIALNWGYEANHPFEREARLFAKSNIPFYICPGTSTWMTLIGKHDNALTNLRRAAAAGRKYGAVGYLITDWGDGGHPQPLAVSYLPFLAGAASSWCAKTFDEKFLTPVLSRDIFCDRNQQIARAAFALGHVHRKLNCTEPNLTPLGAVIAAPQVGTRELFCRNGLKYYSRTEGRNIQAAMKEIEKWRARLKAARTDEGNPEKSILVRELDLAARMAVQSCRFMLYQQALTAGKVSLGRRMAAKAVRELRQLDRDFNDYWPERNKGTTRHCSAFLHWRIADYEAERT